MIKKHNKFINITVLFIATGLVLYFSLKDDFNEIIKELKSSNYKYIVAAIGCMFLYWLLKSISMYIFVKKYNKKIKFKDMFKISLIVNLFNGISPFSVAGQPYEIYSLKKRKMSISDATNSTTQNFLIYQISLILMGLFALIYHFNNKPLLINKLLEKLIIIGFLFNLLVLIILIIFIFSKKFAKAILNITIFISKKIKYLKNVTNKKELFLDRINHFNLGSKKFYSKKRELLFLLLINLMLLFVYYSVPFLIFKALSIEHTMTFTFTIVASAFIMIVGLIVPLPGGAGGLEFAYLIVFDKFISNISLKASMLIWRFITYYFGMIVGLIAYSMKGEKHENRNIY